jgi:hypothetical protein
MLEWIAASSVYELGKLVLSQVQELGKSALEDYVKDFFKDSIKAGVSKANASLLTKPMAEALGVFVKRFVRELEINDVYQTSIDHFYRNAIKQYVNDPRVRPILGQAFEKDLQQIDWGSLERIWEDSYMQQGWMFPEEGFNWQAVAKEYQYEVKGIIRTNVELRELLAIELAEDVAAGTQVIATAVQHLVGPYTGFDVQRYRTCILDQYAYLPLESLGSGMYEREGLNYRTIPLWNIFVAQDVRECQTFQPMDFEIPKELQQHLVQGTYSESEVATAVSMRFQEYGRQPKRSVCTIIGWDGLVEWNPNPVHKRLVILGDPGSGKSSLLRYLAVKWAQQASSNEIPLLIELRHYIRSKQEQESNDFLEFIHHGSQWVGHLDQLELVSWLENGRVILLLDGLDEIVDRQLRATVMKQIHDFTRRFPKNIILITSRVHDYGPAIQELSNAGFFHYKLEDLDRSQIKDFLERWHDATYGPGVDKDHKRERLLQAIGQSKAIQELAANPLLLSLMAILNRAQELPRDRAHLYEKASEVLLHQWDVEAKLLDDPKLKNYPVEIGFRDKRAMLRRVAFSMQNSSQGLAGNSISYDELHACLKDYLQTVKEAQNAPSIADLIIEQLRERNFVLCFLGGDQYGFVHRTFLEYYSASEVRYRFEQKRSIEFEDLREKVFGEHYQDQSWHEVLRLICGMIDPTFAARLIEDLILRSDQEGMKRTALSITELFDNELMAQMHRSMMGNLLLAAECCLEVGSPSAVSDSRARILRQMHSKITSLDLGHGSDNLNILDRLNAVIAVPFIIRTVASWVRFPEVLPWLKDLFTNDEREEVRSEIAESVSSSFKSDESTLLWLKEVFTIDNRDTVRSAIVKSVASFFKDDESTLPWLKEVFTNVNSDKVRSVVVKSVASNFNDDESTLTWLKETFSGDAHDELRSAVVRSIASNYKDYESTLPWLKEVFSSDVHDEVRSAAVRSIASNYKDDESILPWLKEVFSSDTHGEVRAAVVRSIASNYKDYESTLPWLKEIFYSDASHEVRAAVVRSIASNYKDDESTLPWLKEVFSSDEHDIVRAAAITSITSNYSDNESTLPWLKSVVSSIDIATARVSHSIEVVIAIAMAYPQSVDWYKEIIDSKQSLAKGNVTAPEGFSYQLATTIQTLLLLGIR